MTYTEQRAKVVALQSEIARLNHQMENPKLKAYDFMELASQKDKLFLEWDSELRIMHAFPEYQGKFKNPASHQSNAFIK